jgi:pyruvate, orthophosphate dikinase
VPYRVATSHPTMGGSNEEVHMTKWVYGFDEVELAEKYAGTWDEVRGLLGGKGANLGEMTRIGVPVPPGFTITTEACNAYLAHDEEFPEGSLDQTRAYLERVEEASGRRFGDPSDPLLLSCRSGAKFSMPGMMDTVLNIGMNDEVAAGMVEIFGDPRFVYDSYRRLIQMFGAVVLGVRDEPFEDVLARTREQRGVESDAELPVEDLIDIVDRFKDIVEAYSGRAFPTNPFDQLRMAIEAVFRSWNGKRAVDYRNAAGIPSDLGTAVNVQAMVFGNRDERSATGVAMSRNATTGEPNLEGDYLVNAQGEDVVAGIRLTKPIERLADDMPEVYAEFTEIASKLERHYREMQDMEFTVETGKLWLLQTRDGKRTAQASVRIAVDMATEGLITNTEALLRVKPEYVEFFMHLQCDAGSKQQAVQGGHLLATGLNVSPGAAVGVLACDADLAERWGREGKQVILARPETRPDDVHGMLAAQGVVTSRGGRTSHAALVARQFGKPAVVGASGISIDLTERTLAAAGHVVHEGEWLSIDGTTGEVFAGQIDTVVPDIDDPWLTTLLEWADQVRVLDVWTNADYPADAERARRYGAHGIGLCRTEHMFFATERLPIVQRMIMAETPAERREALAALLPYQREDFAGLFRVMHGLPVVIRLIDPPLHEFLPSHDELVDRLFDLKLRIRGAEGIEEMDHLLEQIGENERILERVNALREQNPMLGLRGVRLGILRPALTRMQVRAIFEAACAVIREGFEVRPEVMIPLTSHVAELERQRAVLEEEARDVMRENGMSFDYQFGTMIETPRAALTADEIAEHASFMSFGTNDLTQMTFGISRDDAEGGFLVDYLAQGILDENPFTTIDRNGVGRLMEIAVERARSTQPAITTGICGEHGGDPRSIATCHELGLDYVSCSPFRVPIARLAAAQAAINAERDDGLES